jgi:hypothetical protein
MSLHESAEDIGSTFLQHQHKLAVAGVRVLTRWLRQLKSQASSLQSRGRKRKEDACYGVCEKRSEDNQTTFVACDDSGLDQTNSFLGLEQSAPSVSGDNAGGPAGAQKEPLDLGVPSGDLL